MDVETEDFTRDDIYTLFKIVRVVNHVKACIDNGLGFNSDEIETVKNIFKNKEWFAIDRKGDRTKLPISKRVIEGLILFGLCDSLWPL